jgi:hypothetical protein
MAILSRNFDATNMLAGKFVGVVPAMSFQKISNLKRLLLMFDILALDLNIRGMSIVERRILENARKDIDWLSGEKLLSTLPGLVASAGMASGDSTVPVVGGELIESGRRDIGRLLGRVGGLTRKDPRDTGDEIKN